MASTVSVSGGGRVPVFAGDRERPADRVVVELHAAEAVGDAGWPGDLVARAGDCAVFARGLHLSFDTSPVYAQLNAKTGANAATAYLLMADTDPAAAAMLIVEGLVRRDPTRSDDPPGEGS